LKSLEGCWTEARRDTTRTGGRAAKRRRRTSTSQFYIFDTVRFFRTRARPHPRTYFHPQLLSSDLVTPTHVVNELASLVLHPSISLTQTIPSLLRVTKKVLRSLPTHLLMISISILRSVSRAVHRRLLRKCTERSKVGSSDHPWIPCRERSFVEATGTARRTSRK
jgi:hypothetical protein